MLTDGIKITQGSYIANAVVDSGTSFPSLPDVGELFYRSDLSALHVYNGTAWEQVGLSSSTLNGQPGSYFLDNANATGIMAVVNGGTGASSASGARSALGLQIGADVQAFDADLSAIGAIAGTAGFLKKAGANTWILDNNSFLTGNETITVTGDATGSGATSISLTLAASGVTATTYGSSTQIPVLTIDAKGRVTTATTAAINTAFTITGDVTGTIDGGTDVLTLGTVNLNVGSFGSATSVGTFTVNGKGLVTAAGSATIAIPSTAITDFTEAVQDVVGGGFVVNGGGITATYNDSLNTLTLGSTAAAANTASAIVARDGSGNFSAGTITAALAGNATTATTFAAGRTISLSTDATGTSASFDGSANATIPLTLATVNPSPQTDTFRKITVNGKGLTTATSAVSSADITTSLGYTPVNRAGDTMTGFLILNANPTAALGAVTKQYVDAVSAGLNVHASCVTATTATLASSSGGTITYDNGTAGVDATLTTTGSFATIGGASIANGNRILVKNEATTANNGIYVRTSATVLTRATDFDNSPANEITSGDFTYVSSGTLVGTNWAQTTSGTIVVGTDPIVFSQLSGPGVYVGGSGISITSNSIANTGVLSNVAGTGISVSGATGNVTVTNTGVTSAVAGANISVSGATGAVTIAVTGVVPLATSINGGTTGAVLYQSGAGTTASLAAGTTSQVLIGGASAPSWTNTPTLAGTNFSSIPNGALLNSAVTVGSTSISLGASATTLAGLTSVTSTGFTGALTGNASTATVLQTGRTINGVSFDGSANITVAAAAGTLTGATLASGVTASSLTSVGTLGSLAVTAGVTAATFTGAFSGSGASLTSIPNGALTNSSITIGSTSVSLGGTATTISGLTSVTSTTFVGALTGNASTATSATSATSATTATTATSANALSGITSSISSAVQAGTITSLIGQDSNSSLYRYNLTALGAFGLLTTSNYNSYAPTLTGTGASGTWSINITGNAATLGGLSSSASATASTIVARDGSGHVYAVNLNQSSSNSENPTISQVMVTNGTDNFLRKASISFLTSSLSGTAPINVSGNAATASNATTAGGLAVNSSGINNVANQIARTDSNGYLMTGWINTVSGDNGTTAIDRVYASSDSYLRYYTPTNFRTVLDVPTRGGSGASGTWGINVSGNAATATTAGALATGLLTIANGSSAITAGVGSPLALGANGTSGYLTMSTSGAVTLGQLLSASLGVTAGTVGSGNGRMNLTVGGASNSGYIEFMSPNGTRQGYIGYVSGNSSQDAGTIPYVAAAHSFNGSITATGDITAFSDIRVKKDIEVIAGALSKVEQVRGVTFTRTDEAHAGERQTGVIAQELEVVLPEAVRETAEGMKTVNYGATVGLLIEAIKELSAQNKALLARIEVLEAK